MNKLLFIYCFIVYVTNLLNADPTALYDDLPKPFYYLNLTQDNNIGIYKTLSRRLKSIQNNKLDSIHSNNIEGNSILDASNRISPVFEGLGTHYSFIWVGTPPQRVSVILDTGK